ncbi:MAG TPA: polyprenyl synthetase family protein, partial [Bacillales bacterium]|nr:polyprenyl synthetase family protein [Bacillales bacterium]
MDQLLNDYILQLDTPERLKEAMIYSVQAGGKRIRPVLLLATMEAFGKGSSAGLLVGCAIEMIHTYSLIHDDLPAMDDDDLRRGKPTNHKVFGEAMAILAGDALLTLSFEVISAAKEGDVSAQLKAEIIAKLALAAGAEGMVGGQAADLEAEDKNLTLEALENVHLRKTGRLLG